MRFAQFLIEISMQSLYTFTHRTIRARMVSAFSQNLIKIGDTKQYV